MPKGRLLSFGIFVILQGCLLSAQVSITKPITPPQFRAESNSSSTIIMPAVPPEKVVLTVGDIKITSAQFDAIIEGIPEQFRSAARTTGRKAFADNLVKMLVLADEGKRLKLDETETFKLQEQFQTMNHLAATAFAEFNRHAPVDEAKLQSYYNEHKQEFEQIHARHILVRTIGSVAPSKPGQKELNDSEAEARASELRKRLLAGADFAQLAASESDDPGSAVRGGELDVFGHGQMVPAFDKAAFALQVGVISEPVRTPFGFHLILVDSKEPKPFSEVRAELENRLRPDVTKQRIEDLQKNTAVTFDSEFFKAPPVQQTLAPALEMPVQR